MRPSEVAALTREACHLPGSGWGHLTFADASPAAGKAYTDDGQVHEHRGLKGRTKGRPSPKARRPVRKVPIPPELVDLLRAHIRTFGIAPDGRLFRSENGNPLQPSALVAGMAESPRRVAHARAAGLAADEAPLRPAALRRHLAAQLRRTAAEVAAWGRALGRDADADLRAVRGRTGRRMDRPHGQDTPPGGGPVNSGTHWGRSPSHDGIGWHTVSEPVVGRFSVPASQTTSGAAQAKRPQQDSNLRSRLRRPLLSPLSYGGCATPKGTSRGHARVQCLRWPSTSSRSRPSIPSRRKCGPPRRIE
jgi:hypothetical protein